MNIFLSSSISCPYSAACSHFDKCLFIFLNKKNPKNPPFGFNWYQSSHPTCHSHHIVNISDIHPQVTRWYFLLSPFTIVPLFISETFSFRFLIFQCLRVLSFVSHFLLKQLIFNPMRLFTVVVLALSTLSRFLPLSFSPFPLPPSFFSVSARGQCYTFFFCVQEDRGIFLVIIT